MRKFWPMAVLMAALLIMAVFNGCNAEPLSVRPVFKDTASSEQYDITVALAGVYFDSEEKLDIAECPVTITVYPKGEKQNPVGEVELTMFFRADPQTHMPVYDQNLYCMDVDFDGHDDLVIWTINFSGVAAPIYSVYLYDPAQKTFAPHKELSDLCYSHYGIFKLDKERQRVLFYKKTGCCFRQYDEYIMQDGQPVQVFSRIESLESDGRREWLKVSEGAPEEIGGDTWDWQVREEPKPAGYGDTAREMQPNTKP